MDTVWESSEVLRQFMDLGPGIQSAFLDSLKNTRFYREEESVATDLQNLRMSLREELDAFNKEIEQYKQPPVTEPVKPEAQKSDGVNDVLKGFAKQPAATNRESKVTPAVGNQNQPTTSQAAAPAPPVQQAKPAPPPNEVKPAPQPQQVKPAPPPQEVKPAPQPQEVKPAPAPPQPVQRQSSARPVSSRPPAEAVVVVEEETPPPRPPSARPVSTKPQPEQQPVARVASARPVSSKPQPEADIAEVHAVTRAPSARPTSARPTSAAQKPPPGENEPAWLDD